MVTCALRREARQAPRIRRGGRYYSTLLFPWPWMEAGVEDWGDLRRHTHTHTHTPQQGVLPDLVSGREAGAPGSCKCVGPPRPSVSMYPSLMIPMSRVPPLRQGRSPYKGSHDRFLLAGVSIPTRPRIAFEEGIPFLSGAGQWSQGCLALHLDQLRH